MKKDSLTAKKTNVLKENMEYQRRLLAVSFEIRIFDILMGLILVNVIKNIIGVSVPQGISFVFYVWLVTSVIYLIVFKTRNFTSVRAMENAHFSYYFPGAFYATLLVHYMGGAEWITFFIYLFDLVYANVLLRRAKGFLVTLFIGVSYFLLLIMEHSGLITHYMIFVPAESVYTNAKYFLTTNVVIVGAVFFLVSYSTGLFSKIKEDRENSLLESRASLSAKSKQFENMTRRLEKKAAENKYLKNAAADYIAKKEKELELTRKNLEEQIENLHKTQRSMYFMIEDLNVMSGQLKASKDHLEEKVKERTDELLNISQKLHRSERLAFLGKLAGSVTHELRNPLAVLKNTAYFLNRMFKEKGDETALKHIDAVEHQIKFITSIVDDIMGFAKTAALDMKETNVEELLEEIIRSSSVPEFIKINKEFKGAHGIKADKTRLGHALTNVINNAIMAMKGNGILTLRTYDSENRLFIEVEDTGPGIPADQKELIFEPLYSSRPKGTGLGLPIAKMMVEIQGGEIDFKSELGKGTIFRISLPVSPASSAISNEKPRLTEE